MKWLCTLISSWLVGFLPAQPFHFTLYSQKEGLSNNTVTSICKDQKGFLWIATANGLNRFDGNAFDVFSNNPADTTTIASNDIFKVFISRNKTLWLGTSLGISKYNTATQVFSNYAPDTLVLPKIGHAFPAINEDAAGNLWVGSWYDLLLFNPATGKFKSSGWAQYAAKVKPPAGNHTRVIILDIKEKSATEFWVLTTYGLFSVHTQTLQFTYYPFSDVTDFYGCIINYADEEQNLWIGTYNNGLLCFNSRNKQWKKYIPPPAISALTLWNIAYGIQPYNNDTLLYCGNNALIFFNKTTAAFTPAIAAAQSQTAPLPPANYYNIFKQENCWWLSTDRGLIKMKAEAPLFNYTPVKGTAVIEKIFPVNNTLLAGNLDRAVFFTDLTGKKTADVLFNNKKANKEINSFKQLNQQAGILSTDENVYHLNLVTCTTAEVPLPEKIFPENNYTVRNVVVDKNSNWWIRLRKQGIARYNPATGSCSFASFIPPGQNKEYSALYYDSTSGTIVAAVQNEGIYLHQPEKNTTTHLLLNVPPSQKGGSVSCIIKGAQNTLYMADVNAGIYQLNLLTKKTKRFTTSNGLATNNSTWLCFDPYGGLWIAAQAGLSRLDTATDKILNFGKEYGLPGWADFISSDHNGIMYQPWHNGYFSWNSKNFITALQPGSIYLRHCWVNNRLFAIDSVYHFTAAQNNIAFQFGCLQFENTQNIRFEYRLNKSDWMPLTEQNKLLFSNLAANKYILEVRLQNSHAAPLLLAFIIRPPYYLSGWFIILAALLAVTAAYLLFRYRINSIRKNAALKQKMAETEMMALRAQMNPHFIFNCISSIDNFILDNDKENASSYLNKFAKLIRNILDSSKNDVVPFWKDWETMQLYLQLEQLRSNNRFDYELNADDTLLNGHYKIPPLIIQPYVENAIHHGLNPLTERKGLLKITAQLHNNLLRYCIDDNGVGRGNAAANSFTKPSHQSYGMALTQERIALFNEQDAQSNIEITDRYTNDNIPCGTTVYVHLKI